jgi:hypothetical protein
MEPNLNASAERPQVTFLTVEQWAVEEWAVDVELLHIVAEEHIEVVEHTVAVEPGKELACSSHDLVPSCLEWREQ